ncbi:hypothetical protein [uncultured Chryseobacterium sp.]|uniref:HD domain-containing protein n=1 Tax=uncultured Chryseobacterium sp. TaxID=259322 RepID=UPI0025D50984|nr:hypothetical protein [uncultured Chryseobacterium sp.]
MNLRERFTKGCLQFADNHQLIEDLWAELEKKYTEKGRHYHNLAHLESMFAELDTVKDKIADFSTVSFSVFYHDAVYDATSKKNEEKSAEMAVLRLDKLGLSPNVLQKVSDQILSTKAHHESVDRDTDYLLDADLSVLGKSFETYMEYTKKIRKEYSIYPDFMYKPGRKKVLQHFLELKSIFKTNEFRDRYEVTARENIRGEIESL